MGEYEAALREIDRLERAEPQNLSHPVLAAAVLVNVGAYRQAIERYERILAEAPDHARLQMSYGHALKTLGRQDESVAAYRRAIALQPDLGEAWWSLANLKTLRFTAQDIAAMRRCLAREGLDAEDEWHLHFALGKALEDGKDYDAAFAAYAKGNELKRARSGYDAAENTAALEKIAASCTRQRFERRRGCGHPAPDPIFIVGLPRAGSTLLEQILASHSMVDGTMELPYIPQFARRLGGKKKRGRSFRVSGRPVAADRRPMPRPRPGVSGRGRHSAARRPVLHRQAAEQLRPCGPDSPDAAERQDHRRPPATLWPPASAASSNCSPPARNSAMAWRTSAGTIGTTRP